MCVVCGCGEPGAAAAAGALHVGADAPGLAPPGPSAARAVRLEADVLGANKRIAAHNRAHFAAHGVRAYNLVSSPGAGKTTLLCATLEALRRASPALPLGVIEGDQQTRLDADRIRATGVDAIQVNTGKGCHLDAQMVARAFEQLDLHGHGPHPHLHGAAPAPPASPEGLLFIENVGNLVCPALWDLGERAKVVVLSVTEGEDKPLKYPDMFAASALMLLNKVDLLPHLDFDLPQCIEHARRVNPDIEVLQVSARTGQGLPDWIGWLRRR
jgi:hydrogenase nickel incorporation protein HypB